MKWRVVLGAFLSVFSTVASGQAPLWLLVQVIPVEQGSPPRVQIWPFADRISCQAMQQGTSAAVPGSLAACEERRAVGEDNVTWVLPFVTATQAEQSFFIPMFRSRSDCDYVLPQIRQQMRERQMRGTVFGCHGFRHS
ncbi:hypothetical protein [Dankookia sp. P2]|uniref:hypothetical protein n=1 Tax=Dankookia sp. P2 TaxID=3423955 RepID=UPI003D672F7C